jgi:hypothetical protein
MRFANALETVFPEDVMPIVPRIVLPTASAGTAQVQRALPPANVRLRRVAGFPPIRAVQATRPAAAQALACVAVIRA